MKKTIISVVALILCILTVCCTGCGKAPTSKEPPTKVDNYNYDPENNYFTDIANGETKFITVSNGEISQAKNYFFQNTVSHNGLNYKINFTFSKVAGKLVAADLQEKANDAYYLKVPQEQEKGIFICLRTPTTNIYPLLFDTRNSSVKDVLAGTEAHKLWITDFSPSPDFKKFLLVSEKDETVYFCFPREKNLSDMKVLTGVFDLSGAIWANSTKIVLTKINDSNILETWVYDLDTGKTEKTTEKYMLYSEETRSGLILFEKRYALNVLENGKLQSIDLVTGEEKNIAGVTFSKNTSVDKYSHNNGELLLISDKAKKTNGHIAYLLDLKEGTLLKQREIPAEFTNIAYYDENNLIAYSDETSYSVYPMSD